MPTSDSAGTASSFVVEAISPPDALDVGNFVEHELMATDGRQWYSDGI